MLYAFQMRCSGLTRISCDKIVTPFTNNEHGPPLAGSAACHPSFVWRNTCIVDQTGGHCSGCYAAGRKGTRLVVPAKATKQYALVWSNLTVAMLAACAAGEFRSNRISTLIRICLCRADYSNLDCQDLEQARLTHTPFTNLISAWINNHIPNKV